MLYIYFPPSLTHVTIVPCETQMFSIVTTLIFATNYLTTELAHSKLNLAELLVVVTVGLKIVRILARNVPRTRTQALRRQRVSRVSIAPGKLRCCMFDAPGRHPV